MLTKQEKIDKIYSVIADKTLSFGYVTQHTNPRNGDTFRHTFIGDDRAIRNGQVYGCSCFEDDKIIGHPVMIGDVLDYCSKNNLNLKLNKWLNFIEPIERQDDLCISYVYNLIKDDTKNT